MKFILKNVGECLYRAEGSGIYYAVVKSNGQQIRKSLRTTSRKAAERKRSEMRSEVQKLKPVDGSFQDVAKLAITTTMSGKKPRSLKRRLDSLKMILPWFENKEMSAITRNDIDLFVSERGNQIGNRTFNLDLETLRPLTTPLTVECASMIPPVTSNAGNSCTANLRFPPSNNLPSSLRRFETWIVGPSMLPTCWNSWVIQG
jgi:hypothetical protein